MSVHSGGGGRAGALPCPGGGCLVLGGAWSWGGVPGPREGLHLGGAWSQGRLVLGGCLVLGGAWCQGGLEPGGSGPGWVVSQDALRQTPPRETASAVDGTHPTGMHSCP